MKAYLIGNIQYFISRTIIVLLFVLFLFLIYFFYVPSVKIFDYELFNPFYQYFEYLSWWLHLISLFTIISIIIVVLFLFASFFFNIKKEMNGDREKLYEIQFTKRMLAYLYSEFLLDKVKQEDHFAYFRKLAKSRYTSDILFKVIVKIQNLIDEDFRYKFTELFDHTGFKNRVKYMLYSNNISERIIALKVISYLGVQDYNNKISKYIHSKNYALRNEAIVTYVKLSSTNNLDFLHSQKQHISKLGLNEIINAVGGNLKKDKLNYEKMITSTSARLNVAGVMLVKDRNREDQKELVKSALKDKDELVREVAWDVYASMGKTEADLDFMISRFENESQENKKYIMKSLHDFELNKKLLDFLDKIIVNESILLKIYALRMLFEKNISRLHIYQKMDDKKISIACREVADFNII